MPKVAYVIFKEDLHDPNPNTLTLGRLLTDNLSALSPNPQDAKSLWVMLENPAYFHFWWFDKSVNWVDWTAGRVFGTRGELRFWRRGEFLHVVLLTDDYTASLQYFEQECVLAGYEECPQSTFLWRGKQPPVEDTFVETRLPRGLKYPLPQPTTQPRLKVKTYAYNGVPEFVRFCEVTGSSDDSVA